MIKSMHIEGFKCFNDNIFDFKAFNILSGRNASGKTSLLQVLALLHQTIYEQRNFNELTLNGPVIKLGRAEDVLHKTKSKDIICLSIKTDRYEWRKEYFAPDRNDFLLQNKHREKNIGQDNDITPLFHDLTYLSADRIGPQETHSINNSGLYPDVGVRGERAISKLLANDAYIVPEKLRDPNAGPTLKKQVEAHMQKIFSDFHLDIQPVRGTNIATLSFAANEAVGFVRPQNIGYGLSYTLPIYIACLSAKPDDTILIENPEAHLHPCAQSQIGVFLSTVAASGIQLIIETHSDHVLNGIRKSIKSKEHPITANDTQIFFFSGMSAEALPNIVTPAISDDGQLSEWPKDFFDQYEKDLDELVGW